MLFYSQDVTQEYFQRRKFLFGDHGQNRAMRGRMPLGFVHEVSTHFPFVGCNRKRYREIEWWGNADRIDHYIKKIVHGPIQEDLLKAHYDCTGKYVKPENRKKTLQNRKNLSLR